MTNKKSPKNSDNYQFCELELAEFTDFILKQECNNFLQSPYNYARYQNTGREVHLLGVKKGEKVVLATLIVKTATVFKQKNFLAPGGPIMDYSKKDAAEILKFFTRNVRKFLASRGGCTLQIAPNIKYSGELSRVLTKMSYKNLGEYIQVKWIMTRGFEGIKDEDELIYNIRTTHRQMIRYAQNKYGVEVRELKKSELGILDDMAKKAARKHHFVALNQKIYEDIYEAFGDKVKVLASFYEGKPISAAMFIIYGDEVVYLYSGNDPEYAKMCGSYAIQWQMLTYCLKHKIPRYNFFGVRPIDGDGVYKFKQGFRGEVVELQGNYMLPLSPLGKIYTMRKKYQKYGDVA